jgi:hypothetical protein
VVAAEPALPLDDEEPLLQPAARPIKVANTTARARCRFRIRPW